MGNWKVTREDTDPLANRLSIGSPHIGTIDDGYIVYRGDPNTCLEILERAVTELKNHIQEEHTNEA